MAEDNMLDSISYYEDGEVIFAEGSHGDMMYVIHSGQVELSRMVEDEKKVLIVLGRDGFFGEMALLSDTKRTATATAIGRTMLLPLDREAMVDRIESNPTFALHLITSLSERLMRTTSTLITLITAIREHNDEQIQRMLSQDILY